MGLFILAGDAFDCASVQNAKSPFAGCLRSADRCSNYLADVACHETRHLGNADFRSFDQTGVNQFRFETPRRPKLSRMLDCRDLVREASAWCRFPPGTAPRAVR